MPVQLSVWLCHYQYWKTAKLKITTSPELFLTLPDFSIRFTAWQPKHLEWKGIAEAVASSVLLYEVFLWSVSSRAVMQIIFPFFSPTSTQKTLADPPMSHSSVSTSTCSPHSHSYFCSHMLSTQPAETVAKPYSILSENTHIKTLSKKLNTKLMDHPTSKGTSLFSIQHDSLLT